MAMPVLYNSNSPQQQNNDAVQQHSGQVVGEHQPPQLMVGANLLPTENSVGGVRPSPVSIANSGLPPALINAIQNGTLTQQIRQIMIILRSITLFAQYKIQILALLKSKPELLAACIKLSAALNKRRIAQPINHTSHQQRMRLLQQRMRQLQQRMGMLQTQMQQRHKLQAIRERQLQRAALQQDIQQRQLQQAMEEMQLESPMDQQKPGYGQHGIQNDQFAFLMQTAAPVNPQQQGLSGFPHGLQNQPILSPKTEQAPSPIHTAQTQSPGHSTLAGIPDLKQLQNQDLKDLYDLIRSTDT